MSDDRTLPAGAQWATAPLVDPGNVGRFVWLSWNGNRPAVAEVHKVGRTNITVGYGNESLKVTPEGDVARGGRSSASTEQHRLDRDELRSLRKVMGEWLEGASLAELRRVADVTVYEQSDGTVSL